MVASENGASHDTEFLIILLGIRHERFLEHRPRLHPQHVQ